MINGTIKNAIHVCCIAKRYLGQIAEGTDSGEYDFAPFPSFEEFAKDVMEEDDEEFVGRIAPLLLKITQELFDEFS